MEKGLFKQKRYPFLDFSDQQSLKGTKCHLRDRLATTEVALLAKAISLRDTFGVSNFFKVALLAKAISLRGTFGVSEFSDQKSLKGTKCHLRDRLATTEVALLAKAISLRGTFGVSNFFKVALLAKAVSLRGTFGDIIFL